MLDEKKAIQLLKFLERQYYEDKIYFCVDRLNCGEQVEIMNNKNLGRGWFIGIKGAPAKVEFAADKVFAELGYLGGNTSMLYEKVAQRCLDIAAYAYERAQEVSGVLGEEAILANIEAHKAFTEQLVATIKKALGVKDKPKLKLIKQEKK